MMKRSMQSSSSGSEYHEKVSPWVRAKIQRALRQRRPSSQSEQWADCVCDAICHHFGTDKERLAVARTLVFNLKRNAALLTNIEPERLVHLSSEEMTLGTDVDRVRKRARLGGWEPPNLSQLSSSSPWFDEAYHDKQLVLVLKEDALFREFQACFANIPRVRVAQGDITRVEGDFDAFVSPANTMGNMDGGIDRVYADYFGWSYGRPYHEPNPLQLAMEKKIIGEEGLEIGKAILVRNSPSDKRKKAIHLIAAPTMTLPSKVPVNSTVVRDAARAAFEIWRDTPDVSVIRMPAFGTGWGQVPGSIAAAQTLEAFCSVWNKT